MSLAALGRPNFGIAGARCQVDWYPSTDRHVQEICDWGGPRGQRPTARSVLSMGAYAVLQDCTRLFHGSYKSPSADEAQIFD